MCKVIRQTDRHTSNILYSDSDDAMCKVIRHTDRHTQTERQTDRDKQTDIHTYTDRETDRLQTYCTVAVMTAFVR